MQTNVGSLICCLLRGSRRRRLHSPSTSSLSSISSFPMPGFRTTTKTMQMKKMLMTSFSSFSSVNNTSFATMDSLNKINTKPTWLDDGLKFGCTKCGKCCKGSTTNVYLNEVETQMLASSLEMDIDDFSKVYTEKRNVSTGETVTSLKNKDGACILFDKKDNKCSQYETRPLQCRAYPFWKSTLVGKAEWNAESMRCEGINRKEAPLISKEEIVENLILSEIHAKGTGPNWDFSQARELLVHKEEIENWTESFFDMHYSKVLYEDSLLRVVESTVPTYVADEGSSDGEANNAEEIGDLDEDDRITRFETTRRLEFVNSSLYSQTEMMVVDNTADRSNLSEDSEIRVDHSHLTMPSHRVMAGVCELALGLDDPIGRKTVAVIGAGGCAIPSYLISLVRRYLPPNEQDFIQIAAVEPVESILKVAKEFFDADLDSPQLKAFPVDGKTFLTTNRDNIKADGDNDNISKHYVNVKFDIIIVDAYESSLVKNEEVRSAPPTSMLEDPELYLSSLKKGGILIVNVHGDEKWREHVRLRFVNEGFMEEPVVLAVKTEEEASNMMRGAGTNCILMTAARGDSQHLVSVLQELMAARKTKPATFSDRT